MSERVSERAATGGATPLSSLIAADVIDVELAALVWLLAENGVPLLVASRDATAAQVLRQAIAAVVPIDRHAADLALRGGTFVADSFEEVLRLTGALPGGPNAAVEDSARDLGVVLVLRGGRVRVAHYLRPVERDAAGHIQRRPPAILAAIPGDDDPQRPADHFHWAFSDELATRAGMSRDEFETELDARRARLSIAASGAAAEH